jgi:hypothetical protein
VQFGAWIPLTMPLADDQMPAGAGVFQLRVASGLLTYPRGKSAMVAYGGGADVAAALRAFVASPAGARAAQLGPLWVRFAAPDGHSSAEAHLARLRERFVAQFGQLPLADEATAKGAR